MTATAITQTNPLQFADPAAHALAQHPAFVYKRWHSVDRDVESIWKLVLLLGIIAFGRFARRLENPVWPDTSETPFSNIWLQVPACPAAHAVQCHREQDASLHHPLDVFCNWVRLAIRDGTSPGEGALS